MNKVAILAAVAAAFGGVLWMKSQTPTVTPPSGAQVGQSAEATTEKLTSTSVLLFADPREAEARCGCAEVISLARGVGNVTGVDFREFDTRKEAPEAKHYGVRVSPTVIITDADGVEKTRFEGESGAVIAELRGAVEALQPEPSAEEPSGR
ncbi:MAG: hypothetical protein KC766_05425 [Myxococcales bacterium]|nr:hypothetical protein [Myxococcales bacterium]MCB9609479.1 hypothetical protein [Polyangiaceae bacterium]